MSHSLSTLCTFAASCYNPLEGKAQKVDVEDKVNVMLSTPGTYTVKYTCKNGNGLSASPKTRTVVVDAKASADWWEGEAQIQIGGTYTIHKFVARP